ncbi:MAG TPA: MFS transporter [Tepidisphaeraceae bacterium]|nr:MFS transporter [Tepidisphaeraceae bacterium]
MSADPTPQNPPRPEYEPPDTQRPASMSPTEGQLEGESPVGARRLEGGREEKHDPYAALRLPDYRAYCLGWVISVVGRQIQDVAIGYEIYERTGSKLALGWIGLAQAIPLMLFALPAGHFADRFDRRRIVMITQAVWVLSSAGLAAVSHLHGPVWAMYVLLGAGSAAHAAGWPARASLMPQIVPPDVFNNAVTWNSSFFQIASVVGPAVGGALLLLGAPAAYLVDAGCGATFLALIGLVRLRPIARSTESHPLRSFAAGVRFVWRNKILLATMTLDLFAVLLGGSIYLLPVFAKDILKVEAVGFGVLKTAPAVGAFVAAMFIAHLPPMKRAGWSMLWAVAGFGAATVVFAVSKSFWLSFAMLALTGAFDNVSVVVRHTLVQALPPDSMRGRVAAVNAMFIGASNELGGLESGLTAAWWGPVGSVLVGGVGTIVVVALVAIIWPQVRRFGSLKDARPLEEDPPGAFEVLPVPAKTA